MKCPKCGYNSFEYYDLCINCSLALSSHKAKYGLEVMLLPQTAKDEIAGKVEEHLKVSKKSDSGEVGNSFATALSPNQEPVPNKTEPIVSGFHYNNLSRSNESFNSDDFTGLFEPTAYTTQKESTTAAEKVTEQVRHNDNPQKEEKISAHPNINTTHFDFEQLMTTEKKLEK